jgi:glutaminyl-tRNA synthetase
MINPASLEVVSGCKVEPRLGTVVSGSHYQFERQGYFSADADSRAGAPVFNRTVSLRNSQQSTVGS